MDPLALFLIAGVSLFALSAIAFYSYASWRVGVALSLFVFLWRAAVVDLPGFDLGAVNAFPDDILFGVLFLVGIVRLVKHLDLTAKRLPWLALGLIAFVALYLGVGKFGVKTAGNEARRFLYFFIAALYISSFRLGPKALQQFIRILNYVSLVLLALAVVRWFQWIIGIPVDSQFLGRIDLNPGELPSPFRVLYHTEALFLCQVLLINLWQVLTQRNSKESRVYVALLFPAVVILQHRTVWVVMLIVGALMILRNAKRAKAVPYLLTASLIIGAIVTIGLTTDHFQFVKEALTHSVDEALHNDRSTFMWRVEGWQQLLARPSADLLTGEPFGSGYSRIVEGWRVDYSPHNYYIETLLRLGVAGLLLLVGVYVGLLWRCAKLRSDFVDKGLLMYLLASQLIYYVTYPADSEQGLILGFCAALALQVTRSRTVRRKFSLEPWVGIRRFSSSPSATGEAL